MNSLNTLVKNELTLTQISSQDIPNLIHLALNNHIKILSLDCFDTIIWRRVTTPSDLFYELQHQPTFKKLGLSAQLRLKSESAARKLASLNKSTAEVSLKDIYKQFMPTLSQQELETLSEEEMAIEFKHCYAFQPMIELINQAHSHHLKIIVVSDTYFNQAQLTAILKHCLPLDTFQKINTIYSSSTNGISKVNGLFHKVLALHQINGRSVLHVGDNQLADFTSAHQYGLHAAQLIHHDNRLGEWLRLNNTANLLTNTQARKSEPLYSPFNAYLATRPYAANPTSIIAHTTLGPLLYCFSLLLLEQIKLLSIQGTQPKVLFLMRDGHLLSMAAEALNETPVGEKIFISRFTTLAASFTSQLDIDEYLLKVIESKRYDSICKQLLLSEPNKRKILQAIQNNPDPTQLFLQLIHSKEITQHIIQQSAIYRKRLVKYLQKTIGLAQNDTLLFVDLGYTGTTQNKLAPLFKSAFNNDSFGCYLISLDQALWSSTRVGLLDPSCCDSNQLGAIVNYVSLLEMVCTSSDASVMDYDESGNPIFSDSTIKATQHTKIQSLQLEIITAIKSIHQFFKASHTQPSMDQLRAFCKAELMRFLFLPTNTEIEFLKDIQFDINLGTKDVLQVMNPDQGVHDLQKRGVFFMECNAKSMRTNYPADLRYADISYALMLLQQQLTGFDIRHNEMSLIQQPIQIVCIDQQRTTEHRIEAKPTFNGYFSALIPLGKGKMHLGISFGLHFKWLQIESAESIPVDKLYSATESLVTNDISAYLSMSDMKDHGGGLFECESNNAMIIYKSETNFSNTNICLRLIFRPIVKL